MPRLNSDHPQRRDLLRAVLHGYFTSDDAELLRNLQSAADYVELASGEVLLRQGEISDFLVQRIEVQLTPAMPFQMGGDFRCEAREKTVSLAPQRIRLVDFYAPPSAS